MTDLIKVIARAIARIRYGSDGYREEDDGIKYWTFCVDEARAALSALEGEGFTVYRIVRREPEPWIFEEDPADD